MRLFFCAYQSLGLQTTYTNLRTTDTPMPLRQRATAPPQQGTLEHSGTLPVIDLATFISVPSTSLIRFFVLKNTDCQYFHVLIFVIKPFESKELCYLCCTSNTVLDIENSSNQRPHNLYLFQKSVSPHSIDFYQQNVIPHWD